MKFVKVDHIGIAVPNLKEAVAIFSKILGRDPDHLGEVKDQKVRTAFFSIGESNLELLESTSPEGPVGKFIQKQGRGGIHHICLEVEKIEETLAALKRQGFELVDECPRTGARGRRVAFLHPRSTEGVLIELSETVK